MGQKIDFFLAYFIKLKKSKDTARQANLASEDKNVILEEEDETDCVPNYDDTVKIKKEVKKSRKNGKDVREKIMTV